MHVLEELPGAGIGTMPLTPVVHWMMELGGDFHRFSQSILLALPPKVERDRLVRTLAAVVDRHDALRSSLRRTDSPAGWSLEVAPIGSVDVDRLVDRVEFSEGPGTDSFEALAAHALERTVDTLDPATGSVVRFVWFAPAEDSGDIAPRDGEDGDSGEGESAPQSGRLLVVIHHLAVDGVSWRVLVPDFASAWAQIAAGRGPDCSRRSAPRSAAGRTASPTTPGAPAAWPNSTTGAPLSTVRTR